MKVVMVGLGYIGLPTAALIASKKIEVHGVDIDRHVVDTINRGQVHIVESDLAGLVHHVVTAGFLKAATSPVAADIFIISVPTPFSDGHQPDVSYVEAAVKAVIPTLQEGNLLIIESTSPVGTTAAMAGLVHESRPELQGRIHFAYCPERVLPGRIIYELEHNDRVIGGLDDDAADRAEDFYSQFVKGQLFKTNARTAEMCKLVENAYRDVNIAFANELSVLCDKMEINVWDLIRLANRHPRVNILNPGPGVGGHCIAVDPWFIVAQHPEEARLIRTAREINDQKPQYVIRKVKEKAGRFHDPVIGCLGITYKPDIDDVRESPALEIVRHLLREKFTIMVAEPNIAPADQERLRITDIPLYPLAEVIAKADLLVLLVSHKEFTKINRTSLLESVFIDTCGAFR